MVMEMEKLLEFDGGDFSMNHWKEIERVLAIKATFEKNLKELYLCYLKSPKHSDFGLCRFWEYLNYNGYFSDVISGEMSWGP
ncbi:hypothetical protein ACLOJK_040815 [Asimina triloba]